MSDKIGHKTVKVKFKKGQTIILQGTHQPEIFFLNEGSIEVKRCGENIKGFTEEEIIARSKRIGVITGPSIIGVENLLTTEEQHKSFIAMSDCQITKFMIPTSNYMDFFRGNPQIAMNILLTMKDFALKSILNLKKYVHFTGEIEKIIDNFNLFYNYIEGRNDDEMLKTFEANGGIFPPKIEGTFLADNYSSFLRKTYGDPGYDPNNKFHGKKLEFYHHLLKTRPDAFIKLISNQLLIFSFIYDELSQIIHEIMIETEKFASRIDEQLQYFFYDNYSPFNSIVKNIDKIVKNPVTGTSITKAVIAICRKLDHMNKKLCGIEHTDVFPKLDRLTKVNLSNDTARKEAGEERFRKMLHDSRRIILDYAELPDELRDRLNKNFKDIPNIDLKDPTGKVSRGIIRKLQFDFFELFKRIMPKCMGKIEDAPLAVQFFVFFGFIDENLLTEEQLEFLHNSLDFFIKPKRMEYPVITVYEYLYLIYTDEESPGLSAGGEEFVKILRKAYRKDTIEDTPDGRLLFELENMIKESMRITSDNPRAYIPFLMETSFRVPLTNALNTPKKVETFIKNITNVDYTVFFRELTWKIPGKSELIRKEVKPYLILTPNSGIRVQLWQEIVNNSRSSRGRFILPVIFNGDLHKSLVTSFAHFRWELNKMIAGSNWMDPVEGGFVGAYYDYTQYFHKMSQLSLETKDNIKQLFYKIKIDRDKFAHDYELWIDYEKEGIAKLNRVVRGIFYRYLPFPREIREKLSLLPLYEALTTKYINITRRNLKSLEAKFHRYIQEDGTLPEDLQAYLDMMRR